MFDNSMRQVKEKAFRPFAGWFRRVPPVVLTGVALLFGLLAAGAQAQGEQTSVTICQRVYFISVEIG